MVATEESCEGVQSGVEEAVMVEGATVHAFRLLPGQDLRQELCAYVESNGVGAAAVLTCVGSLTQTALRYAGRRDGSMRSGRFEIVSLVGTLGEGGAHLHVSLADENGAMFGGHVLEGCLVQTTAEVVLLELPGVAFDREPDPETGYRELVIRAF
jgi:uncharacterized protein